MKSDGIFAQEMANSDEEKRKLINDMTLWFNRCDPSDKRDFYTDLVQEYLVDEKLSKTDSHEFLLLFEVQKNRCQFLFIEEIRSKVRPERNFCISKQTDWRPFSISKAVVSH